MSIQARPYRRDSDADLVAELFRSTRAATPHRIDFPWRLSSPACETGRDIQLWLAEDGSLIGYAAWYRWWAALDFAVRPGRDGATVEDAIFAWAPERFRELDAERGEPLPYWAEADDGDAVRLALLERHGYTLDDDFHYVMLERSLERPSPEPSLPAGFVIRPLRGGAEVGAYAALHRRAFESDSMVPAWRARTLDMPTYRSELDLVAVDSSGRLAGFCVGWYSPELATGQIEPLGVDPDFQRLGLARALMLALFQRLRTLGARAVQVETESTRSSAINTYTAVGFQPAYKVLRKGKWFSPRSTDAAASHD